MSFAFALRGDFPWKRVPAYLVAQFAGAILATLLLWALIGKQGSAGLTLPGPGISTTTAMLWELVLTTGLVSVILGTSSGAQQIGSLAAIGVGSYIALAGLCGVAGQRGVDEPGPLGSGPPWCSATGPPGGPTSPVRWPAGPSRSGFAYILRGRGGDRSARAAAQGTLGVHWHPGPEPAGSVRPAGDGGSSEPGPVAAGRAGQSAPAPGSGRRGRRDRPPLAVLGQVPLVGGDAERDRVRTAYPLKLGRDLAVIKIRMVTAVAADDLERVGVAAFRLARHDAGRLAPQDHRPVLAGLQASLHACLLRDESPRPSSVRRPRRVRPGPWPRTKLSSSDKHLRSSPQAAAQAMASSRCASRKTRTSPGVIQPNSAVIWAIQSMSVTRAMRFHARRCSTPP